MKHFGQRCRPMFILRLSADIISTPTWLIYYFSSSVQNVRASIPEKECSSACKSGKTSNYTHSRSMNLFLLLNILWPH